MTLQYRFLWASLSTLNHRGRSCMTSSLGEHVRAHTHTHAHSGHARLNRAVSSAVGSMGGAWGGTIVLACAQGKEPRPSGVSELLLQGSFRISCCVGPTE